MPFIIPLSILEEGIQQSLKNATRYLEDSVLLFQNERYQSSILLSMISYEESGKTIVLIDYKENKIEVTKTQWKKKVCMHTKKNLTALRAIWEEVGFLPIIPDQDKHMSRFQQEWKNIFTYVDYDFDNLKWTSPVSPKTFEINSLRSFCTSAMDQASKALQAANKKTEESLK